jgi:hypothetical protein
MYLFVPSLLLESCRIQTILHEVWQHIITGTKVTFTNIHENIQNYNPPRLDFECSYWWQKPKLWLLVYINVRLWDFILITGTQTTVVNVHKYYALWLHLNNRNSWHGCHFNTAHKKIIYQDQTFSIRIKTLILQWQQSLELLSLCW